MAMIPFDFDYYKPDTVREAVRLYRDLSAQGKEPLYYSGGTEIITLGRLNLVAAGAIIDIKAIPECCTLAVQDRKLVLGSALTLSRIRDSNGFPLLGETAGNVADRTSRNKITLGGNLYSRFMYREAVLPLLLTDSELLIAGPAGMRQAPINDIFNETMRTENGALLVRTMTDVSYLSMPYIAVKKRKVAEIDYPLVTIAAIRTDSMIRVAFSGVCAFPFRSSVIEEIVNRQQQPLQARVAEAALRLPAPILDDIKGSAAYRRFVLMSTLSDTIRSLGGG
jgi:CO/xanthine dehydrogenase FAD-binding subunit